MLTLSTGATPPGRELSRRQPGDPPVQDALKPSPPPPKVLKASSPFITKTPSGSKATEKEKKSMSPLLILLLALTLLSKENSKETSGHGTISRVPTEWKQHSWNTRLGSCSYPRPTASCWKYPRASCPMKTKSMFGHKIRIKRPNATWVPPSSIFLSVC